MAKVRKPDAILVFNAGSSTLKCSLFPTSKGKVSKIPQLKILVEKKRKAFQLKLTLGKKDSFHPLKVTTLKQAIRLIRGYLPTENILAIGHRVVHGGEKFEAPTLLNASVIKKIKALSFLAPLHNPSNLMGIEVACQLFPNVPQIAVFDTAFHRSMPAASSIYPGPYKWVKQGIKRYGFHGINHQYCMEQVSLLLKKDIKSLKLVTCHLGNGCSLAAITGGKSIDTTMGFTPMEGLMMGTRSGSIDPGILFFLLKKNSPFTLEKTLNENSGLKGISGDYDMRVILERAKNHHKPSQLALDLFIHSLVKNIAAMAAILGGLDLLVFSAGIGENASEVRKRACEALSFLQIKLDARKNVRVSKDKCISLLNSAVKVFVIHAQEDWMIAKDTKALLTHLSCLRKLSY